MKLETLHVEQKNTIMPVTPADRKQLRVYLLGVPGLELDSVPIELPRRQVRALVCYLANSPEFISRERLCGLFWPDRREARARRALSHLLTHLISTLPRGDWLVLEGDRVGLATDRVWVDVQTFARHLSTGTGARAPVRLDPLDVAAFNRLESALTLYRGEFLSGFSMPHNPEFDLWICTERERWRREYLCALAVLVRGYMEREDWRRAIVHAERYVAADALAEEMHRRLIRLYAAVGDRAAALKQYETCAAILERELGVNPLPETQEAYQAARRGTQPGRAESRLIPSSPPLEAPLTGREDAMQLLDVACQEAYRGKGRIVFLTGEAGIGKTRLAQEFIGLLVSATAAREQPERPRILMGSAQPSESQTPYFPVLMALRTSLEAADWPRAASLVQDSWLGECARLLPELRPYRRRPPARSIAESIYSRSLLFEALTRLVLALAADRPLVLFLDDVHWADDTTLAWLGTLAPRLANARFLLLLAFRTEAVTGELSTLHETVSRTSLSMHLSLPRLTAQQVTQLVHELSGQAEGGSFFSHRLHAETDGNPFFLLETLRALLDRGLIRRVRGGWQTDWDQVTRDYAELPFPESIRTLLLGRVRALSPAARQVVEVAAVIGLTFGHSLLWRASGRSEAEIADALDELLARQVIHETLPSQYAFTHDKLQEAVYVELSWPRQRLLHRRVAAALSSLNPDAVVALARHCEQAQDWIRAATFALRAGHAAQAVFAHNEARAHFERALALLDAADQSQKDPKKRARSQRLRIEALDGRGWVLRLLGEMDAYAGDLDEVADLARQLNDRRLQAHACWRQAYAALWFCRYDLVLRAGREGIAHSRVVGDLETEMECVWTMALAARAVGQYSRARRDLHRAWGYFCTHGSAVARVHLQSSLSTLNLYEGRYRAAERTARDALALCDRNRLAFHRRLPLGDLGALAVERGDVERACDYLSESLSIARQIGDRTQEVFCLGYLGMASLGVKNAHAARDYLTEALRIAESVGSRAEQSWLRVGLVRAHLLAGALSPASQEARLALALAEELGQLREQAAARELLASIDPARRRKKRRKGHT